MDLVCLEDLDEFVSETDDEHELLAQDVEHRLLEEYGSNPDDEDRGVGLLDRLSGTDSPATIARLIEADLLKDDRILTCVADVRTTGLGNEGAIAEIDLTITTAIGLLSLGYTVNADGTLSGGVQ